MEKLKSGGKYAEIEQQGYQKVLDVTSFGASIINIWDFFTLYFSSSRVDIEQAIVC